MSDQDTFERILAALYDAMLDDARWSAASALIDDACGITGNDLMVGEGPKDDVRALFIGAYCRGQRREDLEREYLKDYHPIDERVPRVRQLPDSRLAHVTDLYTAEELKTSPTYNEELAQGRPAGRREHASRRAGRLPHHLGPRRPRRLRWLGVSADRDGHGAAASHPAVRPGPAGAGPRRSAEHDRDRPARQPADRRPPPGPPGAHHGGQRPRPEHPAAGRRVVGPGRDAPRPRAGRPGPSRDPRKTRSATLAAAATSAHNAVHGGPAEHRRGAEGSRQWRRGRGRCRRSPASLDRIIKGRGRNSP